MYYKVTINKTDEILFLNNNKIDLENRIKAMELKEKGYNPQIVEIDEDEYINLAYEIIQRNKEFVG